MDLARLHTLLPLIYTAFKVPYMLIDIGMTQLLLLGKVEYG